MKKIPLTIMLVSTIAIVGCGDSEKQSLVKRYFEAKKNKDVATLKAILKKPENAEMFAPGSGFSMTSKNYQILDEVDIGVNVKYSRFCYPDIVVPTVVLETDEGLKIDLMATMKGEFSAMKSAKAIKQFCYDFVEQPLEGKINGKPWKFVKYHSREINWGNEITTSITLYSEDCNVEYSGECTQPSLIISNLKLDGEGGNFTNKENVTIHIPPNENEVVSQGSYRVSQIYNNKVKVEISFSTDEDHALNGFVLVER